MGFLQYGSDRRFSLVIYFGQVERSITSFFAVACPKKFKSDMRIVHARRSIDSRSDHKGYIVFRQCPRIKSCFSEEGSETRTAIFLHNF
jgi:hypothetical protein